MNMIVRIFATCILIGLAVNKSFSQVTYNYTGAVQTYTVPLFVTQLIIDMAGASGGNSFGLAVVNTPGLGGRVQTTLNVTPGDVLNIYVGGRGVDGSATGIVAGGWNGGGNAYTAFGLYSGGSGGGGSDIRFGGTAFANRLVIASGGGGAATNTFSGGDHGGNGGGLVGLNGVSGDLLPTTFGFGGTQVAGGAGGFFAPYVPGVNGTLGLGGDAGSDSAGGGAGGGYYGGGGGCWAGGGGGSSYVTPVGSSLTTHTPGFQTGNGYISITGIIIPLPISLSLFRSNCTEENVELTWQTTSEEDNNYFSIEKSLDGVDFYEIGQTKGNGNSNQIINYRFIDTENAGLAYYRLKQVDFNGKFDYSNIIFESCRNQVTEITIAPNPSNGIFTVDFGTELIEAQLYVSTTLGETIMTKLISNQKNMVISLDDFPKGVYHLTLINNGQKEVKKLVKL